VPTNTAIQGREARKEHAGRTELSHALPFPSENWHTSMQDARRHSSLGYLTPEEEYAAAVAARLGSPLTPVVAFTSAWAQTNVQDPRDANL